MLLIRRLVTGPLIATLTGLFDCSNQMPQDTDPYTQRTDERAMQLQIQELVCYIWDNYLQLWDNVEEIFLMGVGFAYLGVKTLLISRGMPVPAITLEHGLLITL